MTAERQYHQRWGAVCNTGGGFKWNRCILSRYDYLPRPLVEDCIRLRFLGPSLRTKVQAKALALLVHVLPVGDENAENYNPDADIIDNTLCEYLLVQGCTDATACNFDETAEHNGTCEYPKEGFNCAGECLSGTLVTVDGGSYLSEKSWTITACDGNGTQIAEGGAPYSACLELGEGGYILTLADSYADGWDGTVMTIKDATYTVESGATASFTVGTCVTACGDENVDNYDVNADIVDNTSASIPGSRLHGCYRM